MRKLDAEGFIQYTTEQIAAAKKANDGDKLKLIAVAVEEVAKAKDGGEPSIVVKGFEGQEEIEIQIAARTGDGKPPIGDPIDERSANGQGISPNIGDLTKGDTEPDKTDKGDADKGDADKGDAGTAGGADGDDDWPDDLNQPNPERTWGDDPK